MLRSQLVSRMQERLEGFSTRDISIALSLIFDAMAHALNQGQRIEIRGFGTFQVRFRRERLCRNPKTGEKIWVGRKAWIHFKPSASLRCAPITTSPEQNAILSSTQDRANQNICDHHKPAIIQERRFLGTAPKRDHCSNKVRGTI